MAPPMAATGRSDIDAMIARMIAPTAIWDIRGGPPVSPLPDRNAPSAFGEIPGFLGASKRLLADCATSLPPGPMPILPSPIRFPPRSLSQPLPKPMPAAPSTRVPAIASSGLREPYKRSAESGPVEPRVSSSPDSNTGEPSRKRPKSMPSSDSQNATKAPVAKTTVRSRPVAPRVSPAEIFGTSPDGYEPTPVHDATDLLGKKKASDDRTGSRDKKPVSRKTASSIVQKSTASKPLSPAGEADSADRQTGPAVASTTPRKSALTKSFSSSPDSGSTNGLRSKPLPKSAPKEEASRPESASRRKSSPDATRRRSNAKERRSSRAADSGDEMSEDEKPRSTRASSATNDETRSSRRTASSSDKASSKVRLRVSQPSTAKSGDDGARSVDRGERRSRSTAELGLRSSPAVESSRKAGESKSRSRSDPDKDMAVPIRSISSDTTATKKERAPKSSTGTSSTASARRASDSRARTNSDREVRSSAKAPSSESSRRQSRSLADDYDDHTRSSKDASRRESSDRRSSGKMRREPPGRSEEDEQGRKKVRKTSSRTSPSRVSSDAKPSRSKAAEKSSRRPVEDDDESSSTVALREPFSSQEPAKRSSKTSGRVSRKPSSPDSGHSGRAESKRTSSGSAMRNSSSTKGAALESRSEARSTDKGRSGLKSKPVSSSRASQESPDRRGEIRSSTTERSRHRDISDTGISRIPRKGERELKSERSSRRSTENGDAADSTDVKPSARPLSIPRKSLESRSAEKAYSDDDEQDDAGVRREKGTGLKSSTKVKARASRASKDEPRTRDPLRSSNTSTRASPNDRDRDRVRDDDSKRGASRGRRREERYEEDDDQSPDSGRQSVRGAGKKSERETFRERDRHEKSRNDGREHEERSSRQESSIRSDRDKADREQDRRVSERDRGTSRQERAERENSSARDEDKRGGRSRSARDETDRRDRDRDEKPGAMGLPSIAADSPASSREASKHGSREVEAGNASSGDAGPRDVSMPRFMDTESMSPERRHLNVRELQTLCVQQRALFEKARARFKECENERAVETDPHRPASTQYIECAKAAFSVCFQLAAYYEQVYRLQRRNRNCGSNPKVKHLMKEAEAYYTYLIQNFCLRRIREFTQTRQHAERAYFTRGQAKASLRMQDMQRLRDADEKQRDESTRSALRSLVDKHSRSPSSATESVSVNMSPALLKAIAEMVERDVRRAEWYEGAVEDRGAGVEAIGREVIVDPVSIPPATSARAEKK